MNWLAVAGVVAAIVVLILGGLVWLAHKVDPDGSGKCLYEWEETDERGRKIRVRRGD